MESGAQCAMIIGILMTQMWWVVNLASLVRPPLLGVHHTIWDQFISGWKMSSVKEQKPRFLTVATYKYGLQTIGVPIAKMQVWSVCPRWLQTEPTMSVFYILYLLWVI